MAVLRTRFNRSPATSGTCLAQGPIGRRSTRQANDYRVLPAPGLFPADIGRHAQKKKQTYDDRAMATRKSSSTKGRGTSRNVRRGRDKFATDRAEIPGGNRAVLQPVESNKDLPHADRLYCSQGHVLRPRASDLRSSKSRTHSTSLPNQGRRLLHNSSESRPIFREFPGIPSDVSSTKFRWRPLRPHYLREVRNKRAASESSTISAGTQRRRAARIVFGRRN